MRLEPTEAEAGWRDRARRVAREELAPLAPTLDAEERFPSASFRRLGELGLLGMNVPEAYGGSAAGPLALCLALGEVAYACASTAVGMSVTNMVGEMVTRFGSEEQKGRYLPRLCSGEGVSGAFCLSETSSASDAAALATTARREGDRYRLDGQKQWITSGAHASVLVVMARTGGPADGHRGISAFLVEPSFPGFATGRAEDKCGLRGSNTVPVLLDGCEVPAENRLGAEGDGFKIAMAALDGGRITIGAMATGIARAALDAAARALLAASPGPGVEARLADLATGIAAAELMVLRAACLKAKGGARFTPQAAMAKLFATEHAKRVCDEVVQILGVVGYARDRGMERLLRDVRVTTIFEGTSEIQKLVLARILLDTRG